MSILDKYYENIPKKSFFDLDYGDRIKVLTYAVAKDLPFVWRELDKERDTKKQATARSVVMNEKGRSGRSAMPKYTENTLESIPEDERGLDILTMSLETLSIMLKNIIQEDDNLQKARKFTNTLESKEGCIVLFKTQIICSAELLIEKGYSVQNGAFLEARLKAKAKAKSRISSLFRSYYNDEVEWPYLVAQVDSILNEYTNSFLVTMDSMENAVQEKQLYEITDKESLGYYMHIEVDRVREMVTGQKKLFLV